MSRVADSSRNRPFDPIFGAFYPHPAHCPPGRRSTCYEMLRFPVLAEIFRSCSSTQIVISN